MPGISFKVNLEPSVAADTELTVSLPGNQNGGGTLKLSARLNYHPHFFPVFAKLRNQPEDVANADIDFVTNTEIRRRTRSKWRWSSTIRAP